MGEFVYTSILQTHFKKVIDDFTSHRLRHRDALDVLYAAYDRLKEDGRWRSGLLPAKELFGVGIASVMNIVGAGYDGSSRGSSNSRHDSSSSRKRRYMDHDVQDDERERAPEDTRTQFSEENNDEQRTEPSRIASKRRRLELHRESLGFVSRNTNS